LAHSKSTHEDSSVPDQFPVQSGSDSVQRSSSKGILAKGDGSFSILTAGEYGVSLSQSLVFVAPISPRSTTSPGAVFLQGAIWEHNPHHIDVCFLIHYFLWSAR